MVLLLLAVLGSGAWFTFRSTEPEYQGKKLGAWLWELEVSPDTISPAWKESVQAIRAMGTNALPSLLARLQARDSRLKLRTVGWVQDTLELDLGDSLAEVQKRRAIAGFRILGRVAEPAIPQLTALVSAADTETAASALMALAELGGPRTIPPLIAALTNNNSGVNVPAAATLGTLHSRARSAVPALLTALASGDAGLRATAARALGEIGMSAERAVPALSRALADTNGQVRLAAASALGLFGTQAESALPAILALPPEANEFARRAIPRAALRVQCEVRDGGIIRGPKEQKRIAFVFTGHEYAEGGDIILNELEKHRARASFFFTGVFLANTNFAPLLHRVFNDGHYLGPHSDQHLLYCAWEESRRTLVSEEEFTNDLLANTAKIPSRRPEERRFNRYFLPAFEHYNREIFDWSRKLRWTLINYTPGTSSNADYTGEADKNFVSSQVIYDSIVKQERDDPHGLNGFLLLLHLGSGPGRADKFHTRFGELLDYLDGRGYEFVGVDQLLGPRPFAPRNENPRAIDASTGETPGARRLGGRASP
jgi:peptidoglycan/xylan/chitin deacetylase (PgdA/CDA1 family)